jgi:Tfp pilus assembly protein FimT
MVESMIVMVLLGTMFLISLPRMNESVRQRRVIAAGSALNADMPVAFSLAARQRKPVTLSYDAASGEVRVSDRATGTVYLHRALRSTSEYMLDSVIVSPSSVQLFPNGVSSSAFTVRLFNGKFVRQLSVGRTGFTRVTAN